MPSTQHKQAPQSEANMAKKSNCTYLNTDIKFGKKNDTNTLEQLFYL